MTYPNICAPDLRATLVLGENALHVGKRLARASQGRAGNKRMLRDSHSKSVALAQAIVTSKGFTFLPKQASAWNDGVHSSPFDPRSRLIPTSSRVPLRSELRQLRQGPNRPLAVRRQTRY